jgi:hypothetical protein
VYLEKSYKYNYDKDVQHILFPYYRYILYNSVSLPNILWPLDCCEKIPILVLPPNILDNLARQRIDDHFLLQASRNCKAEKKLRYFVILFYFLQHEVVQ